MSTSCNRHDRAAGRRTSHAHGRRVLLFARMPKPHDRETTDDLDGTVVTPDGLHACASAHPDIRHSSNELAGGALDARWFDRRAACRRRAGEPSSREPPRGNPSPRRPEEPSAEAHSAVRRCVRTEDGFVRHRTSSTPGPPASLSRTGSGCSRPLHDFREKGTDSASPFVGEDLRGSTGAAVDAPRQPHGPGRLPPLVPRPILVRPEIRPEIRRDVPGAASGANAGEHDNRAAEAQTSGATSP